MERDMTGMDERDTYKTLLPVRPPAELIPKGYAKKVLVMWLSFLGILIGTAGYGSPVAIVLPVCSVVLFAHVIMVMLGRFRDRPVWLYRQAQQNFYRRRYDKALTKLDRLLALRPDMQERLLPAVMICSSRVGDYSRAADCLDALLNHQRIDNAASPVLILSALDVLSRQQAWGRIPGIAALLPDHGIFSGVKEHYTVIARCNTGHATTAKT
jgi:hypothetical protein